MLWCLLPAALAMLLWFGELHWTVAGLLLEAVDARGTTVDYGYDDAGRVTSISEQGGTGSVTYAYDGLGRRTSMTDASGQTTWDFYPDGATERITSAAGTVSCGALYPGTGLP